MSPLPSAGRIRITGNPSPEEIAAVVMALDQAAADDAAAAARRAPRRPAWQYAGRLESVGGRIVRAPSDLAAPFSVSS